MNQTSTILIVDDELSGRKTLEGMLRMQGYDLAFATSGPEALAQAAAHTPDIILLDVMMPGMDGFEVCRRIRTSPELAEVPIIMVTALDDRDSRLRGFDSGADDFVTKPFDRIELRARIRTITRLNRYRRLVDERTKFERVVELSPDGIMVVDAAGEICMANPAMLSMLGRDGRQALNGENIHALFAAGAEACLPSIQGLLRGEEPAVRFEGRLAAADERTFPVSVTAGRLEWNGEPSAQLIVRDVTDLKLAEEQLRRSHRELTLAYDSTLEGWTRALDLRDKETEGHSQRVTEITVRLWRAMGLPECEVDRVRRGALLHDIGKVGIPDAILLKPGQLADDEWEVMRRHPVYARDMLEPITFLRPSLDIPYCHHEKWDGTGYPRGLRAEEIPIAARIFAVADVWDALRSHRPYRPPWPVERVREHLRALAGCHFDPEVVEVFLALDL